MNSRERFLEVMRFNPEVRSLKWEFGFWGENINQWYREGLPRKYGTKLPTNLTTVAASLYTTAWTHEWSKQKTYLEMFYREAERPVELPPGIAVWGGALYWPSQGFPLALDVMDHFGFDRSTALVLVEQLFHPFFDPTGMYPMETTAGMDVVKLRRHYPQFQMMGGVPKYDMARGPERIEEFLAPVAELLKHGGYVPHGDHCISPGVNWEQFSYYRNRLNEIIDASGSF